MGIQINGNTNNINAGIGSLSIEDLNELDIIGVATASNFKTGTSNVHSTGYECTNINATGIITATKFVGPFENTGDFTIDDYIVHAGDTNTKFGFPANDQFSVETAGDTRLHILSNGNIGINDSTLNPLNECDNSTTITPVFSIKGLNENDQSGVLRLTRKDNANSGSAIYNSGDDGGLILRNLDGNGITFYNGIARALRIKPDGKIGINLAVPTRPLHIASDEDLTSFTGTTKGAFCISNNDYANGEYSAIDFTYTGSDNPVGRIATKITSGGSSLHFGTSNNYSSGITNEALVINSVGEVTIGTGNGGSSMSEFGSNTGGLTIDDAGVSNTGLRLSHGNDDTYLIQSSNSNFYISQYGTGSMIFGVGSSGNERFRIDNTGKLRFAVTNAQVELQTSDGSDNGYLNLSGGGACSQGRGAQVVCYGNEHSGQEGRLLLLAGQSGHANGTIDFYTSGSKKATINNSGCLHVGNVGYGDKNYRFDVEGGIACEGSGGGTGRYGTIYSNFGGDSGNRQVGSYTIHSGQMSMHGNGARYMHIKFDIAAGAMWYIKIEGYEYIGNWTSTVNGSTVSSDKVHYSLSGGYIYNNNAIFNGKAKAHRGITPVWYLDGNDLCVYIDTNASNATNRWGFYRFSGGHDGIVGRSNAYPLAIVAYSFSTGTSNPF